MHGLLEKVLEDTQNVSVPWVISQSDLAPPGIFLVAPARESSSTAPRSTNQRGSGSGNISRVGGGTRSGGNGSSGRFGSSSASAPAGAHSSAGGGEPDLSRPTLKGASGALPSQLAERGRWFARTVGDGAILLTFLPALDVWRKEVSARLERRKALRLAAAERKRKSKVRLSASSSTSSASSSSSQTSPPAGGAGGGARRRQREEKKQQQQQNKKKEQGSAGRGEEEDDSLGLFLFLVRSGDFGLPIEPQSARLRGIRRILLAHIPRSHHQAMAFKPARR